MKTSELQIGDWLYYKGQYNAFPFKVEQITKKKVGYHAEPNEPRMYYLHISEVQPIPLTEEILKKNGWTGHYGGNDFPFYMGKATSDKEHIYWFSDDGMALLKLPYVHSLQHLLKLNESNIEIII